LSNLERTRIDNPHVDGMLLGQVVKDNVVPVTDLYSPGRDTVKNAGNSSVAEAVRRLGITGPSPAVTAAAASNPISTQSRRNYKDCKLSATWHPATVGCTFFLHRIRHNSHASPSLRRSMESLCEEET
jgi:hypothetical protein